MTTNKQEHYTSQTHDSLIRELVDETFAHHGRNYEYKSTHSDVSLNSASGDFNFTEEKINSDFLIKNGELLFSAGDTALAKNIFVALLKSGEKSEVAHYWLGHCANVEGDTDRAINHYQASIAFDPQFNTFKQLAQLYIKNQKYIEAAQVFERSLMNHAFDQKTVFEIHKTCGNCYSKTSAPIKSETHYLKALSIDPKADDILANLGALYLQLGRTDEAKKNFEDAISRNHKNDRALSGLGSCFALNGQMKQAHEFFSKSLSIQIQNPTAIFHLVKCAYELKSYTVAEHLLREYIDASPVSANLLYSLAGLQFHLGKITEAAKTTDQILMMQDGHAGAKELKKVLEKY